MGYGSMSSLAGHIDVWRPDPVPRVCWSYSYTCLPLGGPELFSLCSQSPCRDSVIIRASGGQNSTSPNAQNLWLSHFPVIMSYGMVGFIRRFSRWTLANLMGPLKSREFSLMAEEEEIWRIRTQCALGGNRAFEKECGWNSSCWNGSGNWGPLSSIYLPPKKVDSATCMYTWKRTPNLQKRMWLAQPVAHPRATWCQISAW